MLSKVAFAVATALGYLTVQNPDGYVDISANNVPGRVSVLTNHSVQDHTAASWIWTNEGDILATRPFRYLHTTPIGKSASFAQCEAAGDDGFFFYLNNATVASQTNPVNWVNGQRWTMALSERSNLFAVTDTDTDGPAAFIAACRIVYSDGTIDTILTDSTWRTFAGPPPAGFQSPTYFESSSWVAATNRGHFGVPPWSQQVSWLAFPSPAVNFTSDSKWIWTSEWSNSSLPVETRPFRYTFTVPTSRTARFVTIMLTADDEFTLYVNGVLVGVGSDRTVGYRYVVPVSGSTIVFALAAYNRVASSTAGVIGNFQVVYADGYLDNIATNGTFKTLNSAPPSGFQLPGFNDASWSPATVVASIGAFPFNYTIVTPPL